MTRLTPFLTSRKVLNITYQNPQETLLSTPQTLPTTEPATPQISYTVAEADLPVPSIGLKSKIWVAYIYAAGKFVTAGTLSWRMKKNGSSVATSTLSVAANNFWTLSCFFTDVKPGDVLEVALWSNQTDSNWDYKAYFINISRILLSNRVLYPLRNIIAALPNLTLGNPSAAATTYINVYQGYYGVISQTSTDITFEIAYRHPTYGNLRLRYGDEYLANSAYGVTHATYRPYYLRQNSPSQVIYRGILID